MNHTRWRAFVRDHLRMRRGLLVIHKAEIREVLDRYCRAVDRRDVALLKSTFHPDGVVDYGSLSGNAWEKFDLGLNMPPERGTSPGHHLVMNVQIECRGDYAVSEAYHIGFHPFVEGDQSYLTAIGTRYLDRFERRGGEWKIAQRLCVYDWAITHTDVDTNARAADGGETRQPHHIPPAASVGRSDGDDPSYRLWSTGYPLAK